MVAAEMEAGSAIIYSGNTFHAGGANIFARSSRRGMHVSYCLGWLRQEENQYLTLTREDVSAQPEAVRRMLGFQAHGPYLGVWPEDPDGLWFES